MEKQNKWWLTKDNDNSYAVWYGEKPRYYKENDTWDSNGQNFDTLLGLKPRRFL